MAALTLFLVAGCGPSTRITHTWKAEPLQHRAFKKVIVLGLVRDKDRDLREKMEQHLADNLRELGYDATCSCNEYNPKTFENLNEEEALAQLRNSGADAVLTVVLLDKTRERYYIPGRVQYTPYHFYYNRFWGYTRVMYGRIYTEGYFLEDSKYFWETNLYDLNTNNLIYSAQSESFNPGSSESLGHEYGQLLARDMVAKGVLTDRKKEPLLKGM